MANECRHQDALRLLIDLSGTILIAVVTGVSSPQTWIPVAGCASEVDKMLWLLDCSIYHIGNPIQSQLAVHTEGVFFCLLVMAAGAGALTQFGKPNDDPMLCKLDNIYCAWSAVSTELFERSRLDYRKTGSAPSRFEDYQWVMFNKHERVSEPFRSNRFIA
jgi:hypothetical protein